MSVWNYSTTAGDNSTVGGIDVSEGMNAATINNAIRGEAAELAEYLLDIGGAVTAGGSANALTLTTNAGVSAYADGQHFAFVASADNTTAATLSVDAVGAKAIRKNGDAALEGGEIVTGGHYIVQYDASAASGAGAFMLINPTVVLDTALNALDGLTPAADRVPYFNGATTAALATFTSFGRSLVDDADASAARGTLGLGTIATQNANNVAITGGAVNGTNIGASTPGTGAFTTLTASGTATFGGDVTLGDTSGDTVTINGTASGDGVQSNVNDVSSNTALALVGGAHAAVLANYVNYYNTLANRNIDNVDAGDLGLYSNANPGAWPTIGTLFFVTTQKMYSGDASLQRALTYYSGTPATDGVFEHIRIRGNGGTWSSWRRVFHEDASGNLAIGKTSASEKLDVDGTVNATGYKLSGTALPLTKAYESAEQTVTSAGTLTLAHGLGVEPLFVTAELVCKTTEAGYSVNDVVQIPVGGIEQLSKTSMAAFSKDATNVSVRYGSDANTFTILNKSTGALVALTNANWRMIVRAFA
jgi:hypothetical protein